MSTLHDRLTELADDGPDAGQHAGGELWDRGRRYARLRRRGTAAAAALGVIAVVAVGGVSWQRAASPAELAPASAPAAMPDELFVPSPWLPGTEDAGPLGQLAALIPAERRSWRGIDQGLVGVSATTGEYRFLDLPGFAHQGVALAPDGRHLAYWTTGETTGSPNLDAEGGAPAAGVAIYDAVSGQVARHDIATEHGLMASELVWADPSTLLVNYAQYRGGEGDSDMDRSSGRNVPWQVLPLGGELRDLGSPLDNGYVCGGGDGVVLMSGSGRTAGRWVVDPSRPRQPQRLRVEGDVFGRPWLSPDRTRLAGLTGNQAPDRLEVADLTGGQRADFVPVPGDRLAFVVLTWSDADHVVSLLLGRDGVGEDHVTVVETDVVTGERRDLVVFSADLPTTSQLALDLLGGPVMEAVEPPTPVDPRVAAGLSGGAVLVTVASIVVWRRRVQP